MKGFIPGTIAALGLRPFAGNCLELGVQQRDYHSGSNKPTPDCTLKRASRPTKPVPCTLDAGGLSCFLFKRETSFTTQQTAPAACRTTAAQHACAPPDPHNFSGLNPHTLQLMPSGSLAGVIANLHIASITSHLGAQKLRSTSMAIFVSCLPL
eukprot:CAMPEP_0202357096 /NCGR_PEP_ID=MMETSP1126-20121109/11265_1 /ASSEMBLY_ACC=CAM_ASM_000457 /TAXON_ID=3047 /ORGANISM="Dunaliella tertiolecta, Strain CCMP1320" /LENGTH=152 /DNA_ID=CAMNT_0048949919 /DNA_START=1032 /DNA_END=1491 /DNA_ORIENTATION=+